MDCQILDRLTSDQTAAWNTFVETSPHGHFFQKVGWGNFEQDQQRRKPAYFMAFDHHALRVAALLIKHPIPFTRQSLCEIPCGPVFNDPDHLREALPFLERYLQPQTVQIELNPRWTKDDGQPVFQSFAASGFQPIPDRQHLRYHDETVILDLKPPEDAIFRGLRKTTQVEIAKGQEARVTVRFENSASGVEQFYPLYRTHTLARGGSPNTKSFFAGLQRDVLYDSANGFIALAECEGATVSGAVFLRSGPRVWYTYGASHVGEKKRLPTSHLLHWESIRHAKRSGCEIYDMGGALEQIKPTDPTYGVAVFKTGFSKTFVKYLPSFSKVYHPQMFQRIHQYRSARRKITRMFRSIHQGL